MALVRSIVCFLLLQAFGQSAGPELRCFSCKHEGSLDNWCMEEPFDKKANAGKSVKCGKREACGLTAYEEYSAESGEWEPVVERNCLRDCSVAEAKFRTSFARRLRHFRCESCDEDLCNKASLQSSHTFLCILTIFITLFRFIR